MAKLKIWIPTPTTHGIVWQRWAHGGYGRTWREPDGSWHGAVAPANDPTGGTIDIQPTRRAAQRLIDSILGRAV